MSGTCAHMAEALYVSEMVPEMQRHATEYAHNSAEARSPATLGPGGESCAPSKDPLAVLRNTETFVFVFIFYEVVGLQIAWYDVFKWFVVLSEYCLRQYRHRHVGISIGRRLQDRITLLPYDLSCWNRRLSSPTVVRQHNDDSPTTNVVRASDAVYVDVPMSAVSELFDNFNERTAAVYANNQLPRAGATYPSLSTILIDICQYTFSLLYRAWGQADTRAETGKLQAQMQCAQFALVAVLYLIKKTHLRVEGNVHHGFLTLLFQRTSLHPHTLWTALCQCPGVHVITPQYKFRLLPVPSEIESRGVPASSFKPLDKLILPNAFVSTVIPRMIMENLYNPVPPGGGSAV